MPVKKYHVLTGPNECVGPYSGLRRCSVGLQGDTVCTPLATMVAPVLPSASPWGARRSDRFGIAWARKSNAGASLPSSRRRSSGTLKRRQIQNPFRRYATQAALPPNRRHVHALRHSVAVHVLDAGEDIDFARDHLGHRSIQSTMTYAQLSDVRRHRTMRRLERSRDFPLPS